MPSSRPRRAPPAPDDRGARDGAAAGGAAEAGQAWQRLDLWLWHARFLKARSDCVRLIEQGLIRLNRQPTDKPHARLRPGDVLTLPLGRAGVKVVRIVALSSRRGPAVEARRLYEEVPEP